VFVVGIADIVGNVPVVRVVGNVTVAKIVGVVLDVRTKPTKN
jgi:hypothetical protein